MLVAVIGVGQMGSGIAHVFAQYGYSVNLVDLSTERLNEALITIEKNLNRQVKKGAITDNNAKLSIGRISTMNDMAEAVIKADLVIEAATEDIGLKKKIFNELDELAPSHAILATNTSSISITKIAAATSRPRQVIGMHFMNPVPVMSLVEIIRGYDTSEDTYSKIVEVTKSLAKTPVEVNDYPGFVSNRILMPMINEAIYALYQSVAGVEQIDSIMKLGMAHPMGPLELADFIGLDTCLSIMRVLQDGFGEPKYSPCPLLVNMVEAKKLGRKSGEGFYTYVPGSKEKSVSKNFA